jgi:hypothetical protein
LSECDLTEYMKRAEQKLKKEFVRLNQIFHGPTRVKLMKICDVELLSERKNRLFEDSEKVIEDLIINEKHEGILLSH